MKEIIPYYKPLGFTPLQSIEQLKKERPELIDVPITYAGRLDPMAEGLLLLLAGDAVHEKDAMQRLDKTYEAKILLGFSSDTFDILGLAELGNTEHHPRVPKKNPQEIITAVQSLVGTHTFPYPPYSSKTVNGKPLWLLAREGNITEADLPTREMTIVSAENIEVTAEEWGKIYKEIIRSVSLVSGDFRQDIILEQWKSINRTLKPVDELQVVSVQFTVSSGTYIRTLAHELGGLLLHLKRISIGNYRI